MNIVTGYRGTPHITSNEMQALNQGIFGRENYVLNVGQQFAATLVNATTVSIADGEGVIQGVQFRIPPGETENVTITSGTEGYKRIDYICARYEKSTITGIESVNLVVVQGVPDASSPSAPTINTGDVLLGASPVDFPLYEVDINDLTPTLKQLNVGSNLADWYRMDVPHLQSPYLYNENTLVQLSVMPSLKMAVVDAWINVKSIPSDTYAIVRLAEHLPLFRIQLGDEGNPMYMGMLPGEDSSGRVGTVQFLIGQGGPKSASITLTGWYALSCAFFYIRLDPNYPLSAFEKMGDD
jgi:hypothetical protein